MNSAEPADLIARVRELSRPMVPRPTGVAPKPGRLVGLRAALFDVYGTLLVSACGDVGAALAMDNEAGLREALAAFDLAEDPDAAARRGIPLLFETIEARHARRRAEGVEHPEVDIRRVWRAVLERLAREGLARRVLDDAEVERFAVEYEARVNPVWPMPGAREVLRELCERGLELGIVSNAQFFTPLLFPAVVGAGLDDLGVAPDLRFWSWKALEAKPSTRLYEDARARLLRRGIAPEQVVYVGNDLRNDIAPAERVGFRTALFAGDARSLRLREDDPALAGLKPDLVLTRLDQLPACVG